MVVASILRCNKYIRVVTSILVRVFFCKKVLTSILGL